MNEEIKEKKLTKEQKKDLKLKEKFKEIDKKFKRVDKLYKLSTEFEGFRNEEFNQLKESLCNQIDKHIEATISQYSHEIMTDIRDHQLGTLPIVSSKEAIRMLKKEVDELKKARTKQGEENNIVFERANALNGEIVNIYSEINSSKDDFKGLQEIQSGEVDRIFSNINLLESDIIKKDKYQNERLNKQAETHRLKIEQIKKELSKIYFEIENNKTKNELVKYLIFFIALNFGLTIFLLINFLLVFDF